LIYKIFILFLSISTLFASYEKDDSSEIALNYRHPDSHIKVFFPTMPYLYLSKLINGTLVRSSDNEDGYEHMMAESHEQISKTVYDFFLVKGAKFQDGTAFNADSVIENFNYMLKTPFNYSDLFVRLKSVEKISDYHIRFTLKEPYELFMFDLTMINLYSSSYLKEFGWGFKGASTSNSMKHPGPYGLGPYVLKKGYAVGGEQTPIIELEANKLFYDPTYPYIEKITIYTQLDTKEALEDIFKNEGLLDISPIPFNKKTEAVLSPYTKLVTHPSTHNISVYFNMLKPEGVLRDKRVRIALNEILNQENLLKFVYKNEGKIAPTASTRNYKSVNIATKNLLTHYEKAKASPLFEEEERQRFKLLNGLKLKVYTLERFMFLWKGIEYQFNQYGISVEYETTTSEKELYDQLLTNRASPKDWDILTWGNDDWCSNHPWTVIFNYRTEDVWSTIDEDKKMQDLIQTFFTTPYNSNAFNEVVKEIEYLTYDNAYMLFVPSPNIVLAVNKEIDYVPSAVLLMPLWKAKVTPYHWSVRGKEALLESRKNRVRPKIYMKELP